MLLFGRLSLRIVCPLANVAAALPVFDTVSVQVQLFPRVVAPLTLFVLLIVRSGAVTVTLSLQELLPSSLSVTFATGSIEQEPPLRGLANAPMAEGVAVNCAPKVPTLAAIVTAPPLAVQVRLLLAMTQLMLPVPAIPLEATTLVVP